MISELRYRNSYEKWVQLSQIARENLNDERLAELCEKVAEHIKSRDPDYESISPSNPVIVEAPYNYYKFASLITHSAKTPCPHCDNYVTCPDCPLYEPGCSCNRAWELVSGYLLRRIIRG